MNIVIEILFWINFTGCVVTNSHSLYLGIFLKKHSSMIPLIGGITGALAIRFSNFEFLHEWWWLALILDVSWGFYIFIVISSVVKSFRK